MLNEVARQARNVHMKYKRWKPTFGSATVTQLNHGCSFFVTEFVQSVKGYQLT